MLLVVAAVLLHANAASAQSTHPATSQPYVEFRLTLTPDREAEAAGAVQFSNWLAMGTSWIDQFTGCGCVIGAFDPAAINLRRSAKGDSYTFEVSCRTRSKDDASSRIEWKGKLQGETISGDVWITTPGKRLTPEQIATKRIDRNQVKHNETLTRTDGTVVNDGEDAAREADRTNALLATQGRRLHFTFSAADVVTTPVEVSH